MANQTITTNTKFDSLTWLLAGEATTINSVSLIQQFSGKSGGYG